MARNSFRAAIVRAGGCRRGLRIHYYLWGALPYLQELPERQALLAYQVKDQSNTPIWPPAAPGCPLPAEGVPGLPNRGNPGYIGRQGCFK